MYGDSTASSLLMPIIYITPFNIEYWLSLSSIKDKTHSFLIIWPLHKSMEHSSISSDKM